MKKVYLAFLINAIILVGCIIFTGQSWAISADGFTISIVHDGYPVREIDNRVAIPFDAEYRIRLKNGHDQKCTAKVFIDGTPVSKLGDFIIDSNGEIDLERFLDSSLTDGRRFKFVRLSHPDVDDPTRVQNGIVRVEFRLEKKPDIRIIIQGPHGGFIRIPGEWDGNSDWHLDNKTTIRFMDGEATYTSAPSSVLCSNTSSTEPGATIAGSESNQTFHRSHIDVEDQVYALELRMIGISQLSLVSP